jgi:hypothetical protein
MLRGQRGGLGACVMEARELDDSRAEGGDRGGNDAGHYQYDRAQPDEQ